MDEELNYASVTFRSNSVSTHEKPKDLEIIYDEVKCEQQGPDTSPLKPDNKKKAPLFTLLHVVAAVLMIICVSLLSVLIALNIHFDAVVSERLRENGNLTAQNLQLWTEKNDLERQKEELTRERDGLNWTMGVILEHKHYFPVEQHCPQKVCKPCLDDWVQFQTNCYFFSKSEYYSGWKSWAKSREECSDLNADLVVIESQEEQEFINNHIETYRDEKHGYWIGLRKQDVTDGWKWVDGSNVTITYWTQERGYSEACALTLPSAAPLANWNKASCGMYNRWICETRALIKGSAP